MKPLVEANHRADDSIALIGMPLQPVRSREEVFRELVVSHRPELLALQMDPMPFLTR